MKNTTLFFLIFLVCVSCKNTLEKQEENSTFTPANSAKFTAETIAKRHGFEYWKSVSEIQFTFNVDRGDNHFERSWTWFPKTDVVTLKSLDKTITYNRNEIDSLSTKADQGFINDKFWLLAPFNLMWDKESMVFSEKENVNAPISKETLNQLTITYDNEGGYTPGDAYDFYYTKNFEIKEWVFRKGNDSLPTMINTWEDYVTLNNIKIAKKHQDSTGGFKLYFTDILIK